MKQIIILLLLVFGVGIQANSQNFNLDSCKYYALKNNKRLKEVQLKVDASKAVKKNAFTNYFPKVDAGAFVMKSNKSFIEFEVPEMNLPVYDGNPANLANPTQFTYFPGMALELLDYANLGYISAVQPLYVGGRIRNGNKLAALGTEINKELLELSTDEVVYKTEEYYWMIVNLQNKVHTLESYKALLNNLQNDASVSYESGLLQKSDLLKVQLKLNEVEANKLKLENGIELLKMVLCQHIGIEYSDSVIIADSIVNLLTPEIVYKAPETSLENRKEFIMLNKAITAEKLQRKMAVGENMPSLAIGVTGTYLDVLERDDFYGIAFATLSIPISSWWGGSYKIKEHKIKVEIAENNLVEKSELLMLQMDKGYKELTESYKQIAIAELSRSQANEHLKVMQDNYKAGVVSTSDLLEAQAISQEAEDALVDAKSNYKIKLANYKLVTAQKE